MIAKKTLETKPRCTMDQQEKSSALSSIACEQRYESMIDTLLPTGYRVAYIKRNEMHDELFYIYAVAKSFSHTMEVTSTVNRQTGEVDLWKYAPVPLFTSPLEAAA
ncbi:MAG: hypothetical protein V2J55_17275 [Candidatus Competibacteraceae bacterium]|jgi:hypothetical protein|nr:hypothetical protein [Candidatus Competibacteraceae bacterium]